MHPRSLSHPDALDELADAIRIQMDARIARANEALQALSVAVTALQNQVGSGLVFMLKNKFGMTKNQAQKLFYDFKKKNKEDDPNEQMPGEDPKEPGNVEEKISMIMGYMKETSDKLDQIERDISFLKDQVDKILQKI